MISRFRKILRPQPPYATDLPFSDISTRAGVATDQRGYITVDDQLRTNVPGIWALGDCNPRGAFTHTSYKDYEIVGDNLFNADDRRVSDRIQANALYIDPSLG